MVEAGGVHNAILNTPTTSGTLTDTDVDNLPNTFYGGRRHALRSDHGYGSCNAMTSGGTWSYTLDNNNTTVQQLNVGQTLTDTFTVDTVDGTAHQVTITIDGANDAAVVGGTTTGTWWWRQRANSVNNSIPGTADDDLRAR